MSNVNSIHNTSAAHTQFIENMAADLLDATATGVLDSASSIKLAHALLRGTLVNAQQTIRNGRTDIPDNLQETIQYLTTMYNILRHEVTESNSWLNRLHALQTSLSSSQ
ncbi:hypothetical protein GGG16DRAFT_113790 [Schizophyllum commune]